MIIIMNGGFLGNACERGQGTAERELRMYIILMTRLDTAHGLMWTVTADPEVQQLRKIMCP